MLLYMAVAHHLVGYQVEIRLTYFIILDIFRATVVLLRWLDVLFLFLALLLDVLSFQRIFICLVKLDRLFRGVGVHVQIVLPPLLFGLDGPVGITGGRTCRSYVVSYWSLRSLHAVITHYTKESIVIFY